MDMGQVTRYTAARYPVLRKFHVGRHPLLIEDQMKEMRPLPMTEKAVVDHVVQSLQTNMNNPLEYRVSEKEVSKWRQRKLLEGLPDNVNHWFAMEFTRWLRGVSQFNHPQMTWWGNHNLFHVPEVVDYLKELVRMRLDYQQRLLMMTVALPKTLNDCWLYFKYIVAGHGLMMRPADMAETSDFYAEQDTNAPSYMTIGGMLDFLDDFSQTTFYKVDVPAMQGSHYGTVPAGIQQPVIQKAIGAAPDGNVQSTTNNTGDPPADPDSVPDTDAAGKPRPLGRRRPPDWPRDGDGGGSSDDDDDDDDDDDRPDTNIIPSGKGLGKAAAKLVDVVTDTARGTGTAGAPELDEDEAAANRAALASAASTAASAFKSASSAVGRGFMAALNGLASAMVPATGTDVDDDGISDKDAKKTGDKDNDDDKTKPKIEPKKEKDEDRPKTRVIKTEPPRLYPRTDDLPDQPEYGADDDEGEDFSLTDQPPPKTAADKIPKKVENGKRRLLQQLDHIVDSSISIDQAEVSRLKTAIGAARTQDNIASLRDQVEALKRTLC